jgi:hypothetical protein
MYKQQHGSLSTSQSRRQAGARQPKESGARSARALMEGRREAVDQDGLIDLQRTAGNEAVARLIGKPFGVVARSPSHRTAPVVQQADHQVDDEAAWAQLTPSGLIQLYISGDDQYVNGEFSVPHTDASFTGGFIRSHRANTLELIREKIAKQHDRAGFLRETLKGMHGQSVFIDMVRQVLTHEYQQDLKGQHLSEDEGTQLRENTKNEIVESMEEFGYACQNQKAAVRKELAEDGEFFGFILEIAFSFIPVGGKGIAKLVAKGMKAETVEKIEHGLEIAEKWGAKEGVDASLKRAQRALKDAYSSSQSEGEAFIERLKTEARKAAEEVLGHVDRMTFSEMAATFAEFAEKMDTYEKEIAEKVEMFKKSAGHIGETRYWEYGYHRATLGGDTQAAKIQTPGGKRIALITYEKNAYGAFHKVDHSQPVFLDWVPRQMEKITVEKSKGKYGEPIELTQGGYYIPPEYSQRWLLGIAGAGA